MPELDAEFMEGATPFHPRHSNRSYGADLIIPTSTFSKHTFSRMLTQSAEALDTREVGKRVVMERSVTKHKSFRNDSYFRHLITSTLTNKHVWVSITSGLPEPRVVHDARMIIYDKAYAALGSCKYLVKNHISRGNILDLLRICTTVSATTDATSYRENLISFNNFDKEPHVCFSEWIAMLNAKWDVLNLNHPGGLAESLLTTTLTHLLVKSDKRYLDTVSDIELEADELSYSEIILRLSITANKIGDSPGGLLLRKQTVHWRCRPRQ